ncbi:MAG: hypothetical protein IJ215_02375 [Clostridia bacterium]|nr:hypothetical protein [Clostridia bacterium]
MSSIKREEGNILTIGLIFVAIAIIVFLFIIAVFMSHINSILYNMKLDMYSMNKSAIIAVNKNKANVDNFSYDKETYKKEFIKLLKMNYDLDDNLRNADKLIYGIDVKEYEVYENKKKDSYSNKNTDGRVIHTVLKVRIKPIILRNFLENIFIFDVHEDVSLNMLNER